MGYPIGLAPLGDGTGTEPEDMQRWIWSLYRTDKAALVRGCEVSGMSSMKYKVTAGVIVVPTGSAQAIAVPIDAVEVNTPAAPSTGSRTDYVYATDDGAVQVGTSQPSGTALLGKFTVPANITATTAAVSLLGDRLYAPLYGASMGRVAYWQESSADLSEVPRDRTLMTTLTFTTDSDRRMDFALQVSYEMSRAANVNTDGWKMASHTWETWIDGVRRRTVELGVREFAETIQNRATFDLTAGTHTVQLYRERRLIGGSSGDTTVLHRKGGSENWPGTSYTIVDIGGIA